MCLSEDQRARVDRLTRSEGVTMAEVVRRALDRYLDETDPDPEPALRTTFGALPDASAPDRGEWDRG